MSRWERRKETSLCSAPWGPGCGCPGAGAHPELLAGARRGRRCPGIGGARGSALPGDQSCPGIGAARGSELPGDRRCPGIRAARGSALPGDRRCPGIGAARGSAVPGDQSCPGMGLPGDRRCPGIGAARGWALPAGRAPNTEPRAPRTLQEIFRASHLSRAAVLRFALPAELTRHTSHQTHGHPPPAVRAVSEGDAGFQARKDLYDLIGNA
ncbi:collagen alpha-1(X) chain-like [Prinia subflava]|uniref:collagen alpha-1(X) chain-like n=1 Tax=Prinia subflava TaxID=208062 RepID=UPI002FE27825